MKIKKKYLKNLYHKYNLYRILLAHYKLHKVKKYPYKIPFLSKEYNHSSCDKKVDEIIYCFWTGDNPLTENRIKCLESMKNNCGVEICLITPQNLNNFVLKDYPLHPAYKNLSCVHKADYLRTYFMHHYGGGYSDIKYYEHSWKDSFVKINNADDCLLLGTQESSLSSDIIAYVNPSDFCEEFEDDIKILNKQMEKHFRYLAGNGGYIVKPKTNFTQSWIDELHRRLDTVEKKLEENPGNIWGDNKGYPISWNSILGQIFHPLCLKFYKQIMFDKRILFVNRPYR